MAIDPNSEAFTIRISSDPNSPEISGTVIKPDRTGLKKFLPGDGKYKIEMAIRSDYNTSGRVEKIETKIDAGEGSLEQLTIFLEETVMGVVELVQPQGVIGEQTVSLIRDQLYRDFSLCTDNPNLYKTFQSKQRSAQQEQERATANRITQLKHDRRPQIVSDAIQIETDILWQIVQNSAQGLQYQPTKRELEDRVRNLLVNNNNRTYQPLLVETSEWKKLLRFVCGDNFVGMWAEKEQAFDTMYARIVQRASDLLTTPPTTLENGALERLTPQKYSQAIQEVMREDEITRLIQRDLQMNRQLLANFKGALALDTLNYTDALKGIERHLNKPGQVIAKVASCPDFALRLSKAEHKAITRAEYEAAFKIEESGNITENLETYLARNQERIRIIAPAPPSSVRFGDEVLISEHKNFAGSSARVISTGESNGLEVLYPKTRRNAQPEYVMSQPHQLRPLYSIEQLRGPKVVADMLLRAIRPIAEGESQDQKRLDLQRRIRQYNPHLDDQTVFTERFYQGLAQRFRELYRTT